jgi:hypothetical protein
MKNSDASWPKQSILTAMIKKMKADRPENIRYRERAVAKRVIGLMNRPEAGELGDMPLGTELDQKLEGLLL